MSLLSRQKFSFSSAFHSGVRGSSTSVGGETLVAGV